MCQLEKLKCYKVPRCYCKIPYEKVELHTFTDASLTGYAATVFFRFVSANQIKCSLIAAKSRVAPVKMLSVPRLELMAAVLGVRLSGSIIKEHTIQISQQYFWTDSSTVLSWIKSDHWKYGQYVAFRVAEILECSKTSEWRWVPTKVNVADLATKLRIPRMEENKEWFRGPEFLYSSEDKWPVQKVEKDTIEEMRPQFQFNVCFHHVEFNSSNFSNWNRVLRSQAYVLRFIDNLKAILNGGKTLHCPLLMEELRRAENMLFKKAQSESYADELATLQSSTDAQRQQDN